MSDQPDLLDWNPPAQQHSRTSLAAADAAKPSAGVLRILVLNFLKSRPEGATDEEIITATGMNPSTARPRRIELVTAGFARDSGRTRKTRSGRDAVVWVAVANDGGAR